MQLALQKSKERERRRRTSTPTIESGIHAPKFRGANLEIQSYTNLEWMLSGPAETGKTWAALWRLDSLLRSTPRVKATLARKIQSTIYGTVLVTWEAIQELRAALGYPRAMAFGGEKPQWYSYPNGSRLWVGGLDNPQKILSSERDFIYINQAEEVSLQDWEYCITRATGRGAVVEDTMVFGDCNPGSEDHWILKRATLKVFYSKHKDNPSLYTDSGELTKQGVKSIAALQSLTGIRKKRLYEGQWVGAEGLYFENFDPELGGLHVIEPHSIPGDALIWGALDWGYKHPLAFGLFTENDDGIELIWEHVQHKMMIPHHCRAIRRGLEMLEIGDWRLNEIVAGHDVFAERGGSDDNDARTFAQRFLESVDPDTKEANGFDLSYANIARIPGWNELETRLGNPDPAVMIAPSLRIWSTCTRTIATLTRLVHNPRDSEDVLKVNADPLTGEGGDDCFVAGTLVEAFEGPMPIETLRSGDLLLTRDGFRKAKAIWNSRKNATVLTATLSNGATLTATPNHPFWIEGKGWNYMDTLRYGDIMTPLWQNDQRLIAFPSMASRFEGIQNQDIFIYEAITSQVATMLSEEFRLFMSKYGKPLMVRLLADVISTIKTETLSTTNYRIWNALLRQNTLRNIWLSLNDWLQPGQSLKRFDLLHPLGTSLALAVSGIAKTPSSLGKEEKQAVESASNAAMSLIRELFSQTDFVRTSARLNGEEMPDLMTSRYPASNAANPSLRTNMTSGDFAQENVPALRLVDLVETGKADTFSIHVEGNHEFYANGVLVKNCGDMIRYGVMARVNVVSSLPAVGGTRSGYSVR